MAGRSAAQAGAQGEAVVGPALHLRGQGDHAALVAEDQLELGVHGAAGEGEVGGEGGAGGLAVDVGTEGPAGAAGVEVEVEMAVGVGQEEGADGGLRGAAGEQAGGEGRGVLGLRAQPGGTAQCRSGRAGRAVGGERDLQAPDAVGQRGAVEGGRGVEGGVPDAAVVPGGEAVFAAAAAQDEVDAVGGQARQFGGAVEMEEAFAPVVAGQALAQGEAGAQVVAGVGEGVVGVAEVGVGGVDAAVGVHMGRAGAVLRIGADDGGQFVVESGAQAVGAQSEAGRQRGHDAVGQVAGDEGAGGVGHGAAAGPVAGEVGGGERHEYLAVEVTGHQLVAVGAGRDGGGDLGEHGGDIGEVFGPVDVLAGGVAVVVAAVEVVTVVVGQDGDDLGVQQGGDAEGEVLGQEAAFDEAEAVAVEEGAAEEFVGGQAPVDR